MDLLVYYANINLGYQAFSWIYDIIMQTRHILAQILLFSLGFFFLKMKSHPDYFKSLVYNTMWKNLHINALISVVH